MRIFIRAFLLILAGLGTLSAFTYFTWYQPKFRVGPHSHDPKTATGSSLQVRLKWRADSLETFAKANGLSTDFCFLLDMSIPSGKNRFFVYDLKKDSVVSEGLVAHGSCDAGFRSEPEFSNRVNSGCSCTGRFRIGTAYQGQFGTAFKLHGLDSSNSNAFKRFIVLHAYDCVPEEETYPLPICNSRGCPMVSYAFLDQLQVYIKESRRPILLCIFDEEAIP